MTPRRLPATRSGTHSIERMPSLLVHVAPGRARIGADVVDADRRAGLGAPADDALAHRQRQPLHSSLWKPWAAAWTSRGARRIQQPDAAPGRADERGHRAADAIEHGGDVQAGGDELAGREEGGQLLGAAAALVEQAALLDGRGQRARQLGVTSTSVSSNAARLRAARVTAPKTPSRLTSGTSSAEL